MEEKKSLDIIGNKKNYIEWLFTWEKYSSRSSSSLTGWSRMTAGKYYIIGMTSFKSQFPDYLMLDCQGQVGQWLYGRLPLIPIMS